MTDYMPTTDEVRGSLVFLNKHYAEQCADVDVDLLVVESETAAQFDRWLAEVERAAAARVTPTREQIEDVLRKSGAWCGDCNFEMDHCSGCKHVREVYAESVLRLIQELAEGEK